MSHRDGTPLLRPWEVLGLVLLTVAACAAMAGLALWIELRSAEQAFKQQVDSVQRDLAYRFGSTEALLTSLVGLHHASDELRAYEFAALSRELLTAYPHIRVIASLPVIAHEDRLAFEAQMRSDGFPQFRISEQSPDGSLSNAGSREVTIPVRALEPFEPAYAQLIGFDVLSNTLLAGAANEAISSGSVAASEPLELLGLGRGIFVFKAVYLGYSSPKTADARRAQVSGLIALFLSSEQFVADVLAADPGTSFRLLDQAAPSAAGGSLVYARTSDRENAIHRLFGHLEAHVDIAGQGRIYELVVSSDLGSKKLRWWLVALFVVPAIVACGLLTITLRNHRAGQVQARNAERILRQSKEQFRDFAEVASDWFWATDKDHRFVYLSKRLRAATGLDPEALIGNSRIDQRVPDPGEDDWNRHLADLEAFRPFKDFRFRCENPQGVRHWVSISGKPVFGEDGDFAGYRGTGRNVTNETEVKRALQSSKEQAELASRAKSEFLANVSHELRTPLNAIIGFSELISTQTFGSLGNPRYIDYAKDIFESGQHLLALINDILDLSKIESGVEQLYEDQIEIDTLTQSVLRLMKPHADDGSIELALDTAANLPLLLADERKLKQILVNLMSNSIKFTEPRGQVGLEVRQDPDGWVVFKVKDTGIGISEEDIPKAFSQFVQVDSALNRRYAGTGLGLPLTKALIEQHDGSVELKSQPGKGTVVTFRFPPERAIDIGQKRLAIDAAE